MTEKLLIVDDDVDTLRLVGLMLQRQGYQIAAANNGHQALIMAQSELPDLILLDIMMPEMDGYEVCRCLKQIEGLKNIPIIFISALHETMDKVKAFSAGGVDYITKPFQFEEVQARVKTHLKIRRLQIELEKQNQQLSDLNQALSKTQNALEGELAYAANYILSLIPAPISEADIQTNWLYVPSTRLGGDSLGYHWIDNTYFALYLLDVSGHGVGPALLSVSVLNTLRTQCLPDADFRCPDQVLAALNTRFRKKDQYGLFFTIWYGVFNRDDRMLRYANGGHPPALLIDRSHQRKELDAQGLPVGLFPEATYVPAAVQVPCASKVYVFSDGCYEIQRSDGEEWTREEMAHCLNNLPSDDLQLDALYQHSMRLQGGDHLEDDFSILCAKFT